MTNYNVQGVSECSVLAFFIILHLSDWDNPVTFLDLLLWHLIFCIVCKPLDIALMSNRVFVRNVSIGLWGQNLKRKKSYKTPKQINSTVWQKWKLLLMILKPPVWWPFVVSCFMSTPGGLPWKVAILFHIQPCSTISTFPPAHNIWNKLLKILGVVW